MNLRCNRISGKFQVVSFPYVSPPKPCMQHSSPPYVLHAPPFHYSRLSPEQYLVRSIGHKAPHYVVFSIPLLPRHS